VVAGDASSVEMDSSPVFFSFYLLRFLILGIPRTPSIS
jgi:hypothetical protein